MGYFRRLAELERIVNGLKIKETIRLQRADLVFSIALKESMNEERERRIQEHIKAQQIEIERQEGLDRLLEASRATQNPLNDAERTLIRDLLVIDSSLARFVTDGRWDKGIHAAAEQIRTRANVKRFVQTPRPKTEPF